MIHYRRRVRVQYFCAFHLSIACVSRCSYSIIAHFVLPYDVSWPCHGLSGEARFIFSNRESSITLPIISSRLLYLTIQLLEIRYSYYSCLESRSKQVRRWVCTCSWNATFNGRSYGPSTRYAAAMSNKEGKWDFERDTNFAMDCLLPWTKELLTTIGRPTCWCVWDDDSIASKSSHKW